MILLIDQKTLEALLIEEPISIDIDIKTTAIPVSDTYQISLPGNETE